MYGCCASTPELFLSRKEPSLAERMRASSAVLRSHPLAYQTFLYTPASSSASFADLLSEGSVPLLWEGSCRGKGILARWNPVGGGVDVVLGGLRAVITGAVLFEEASLFLRGMLGLDIEARFVFFRSRGRGVGIDGLLVSVFSSGFSFTLSSVSHTSYSSSDSGFVVTVGLLVCCRGLALGGAICVLGCRVVGLLFLDSEFSFMSGIS